MTDLGQVVAAVHAAAGACVITADMATPSSCSRRTGVAAPRTPSTPVPLIVTARGVELRATGTLADVAPTVLSLLGHDAAGRDDRPLSAHRAQ